MYIHTMVHVHTYIARMYMYAVLLLSIQYVLSSAQLRACKKSAASVCIACSVLCVYSYSVRHTPTPSTPAPSSARRA